MRTLRGWFSVEDKPVIYFPFAINFHPFPPTSLKIVRGGRVRGTHTDLDGHNSLVSKPGFDPGTCELWAHHASAAHQYKPISK